MTSSDVRRGARRAAVAAAAIVTGIAAALEIALWLGSPVGGLPGLLQIASPHIALAGLATAPVALLRGSGPHRLALVILVAVAVGRFGGEWWSWPAPAADDGSRLVVTTWSLEIGPGAPTHVVDALRDLESDVVLLQELSPSVASAIASDARLSERYPHQALPGQSGRLGVLSRFPLRIAEPHVGLPLLEVTIDVDGEPVSLFNGHPNPGRLGRELFGVPTRYDPSERDELIGRIRRVVDARLATGSLVVLAGDFNTASTERAFDRLAHGLRDSHREAGWGPGWTWRPNRLLWLPGGVLRLDVVLASPTVTPVGTSLRCTDRAEHCLFTAELRLPASD